MKPKFKVGDPVRWISSSGGSTTAKHGKVVAVLCEKEEPNIIMYADDHFPIPEYTHKFDGRRYFRNQPYVYLVEVVKPKSKALYKPNPEYLIKAPKGLDSDTFLLSEIVNVWKRKFRQEIESYIVNYDLLVLRTSKGQASFTLSCSSLYMEDLDFQFSVEVLRLYHQIMHQKGRGKLMIDHANLKAPKEALL